MKKIILFTGLFLCIGFASHAQSIFGKWKTIDDSTGKEKSIVDIYEEDGKVYGKVVEILNKDRQDVVCDKCEGAKKDKPVLGMVIIEGLHQDGDEYEGGTILDPEKGKEYKCKIWVDEDNSDILNVRGYIAFLFRTQEWHRVN
ncbi:MULTISPECIES: DUF2147 domain-containing protein [Galbibacter]|uniref:DUF2147 domain-containing protein n=1 Tax=Galbibacter pacificus TaxID=2996052 RepID=A0ABT6FVI3_9FLAO|nr:DUF2147 domain-containing protein [Galbibacter pacificus]MDG3583414.1 DUF2147 domain-containing protein [Galbibacter pacificus]MDG3587109.1 DUF2147 domain-containing protein [Galbibacter pacificus]